jgi:hypothetical protein
VRGCACHCAWLASAVRSNTNDFARKTDVRAGNSRIAFAALFALVPAPPGHAQAGTVIGLIHARFEEATRLNDVVVTLTARDRSVRTDSLGVFRFVALPPGDYLLSARRLGYDAAFRSIRVASDRETRIRIAMIPISQRMATINVSEKSVHRTKHHARPSHCH